MTDPSAESRNRMVQDAIDKVFKPKFAPDPKSPEEILAEHVKDLNLIVLRHVRPILVSGGFLKPEDKNAMRETIAKLFVQGFSMFSKDELVQIVTLYQTEIAMGVLEASPSGGSTPDLLSGQ